MYVLNFLDTFLLLTTNTALYLEQTRSCRTESSSTCSKVVLLWSTTFEGNTTIELGTFEVCTFYNVIVNLLCLSTSEQNLKLAKVSGVYLKNSFELIAQWDEACLIS